MKNMTILVALFLLAGQLVAADRAGGKNILRWGRAFHPALFLSPRAAEGAQAGPQWKSPGEYDAFRAFAQEQDANKKIAQIDAFLEKYKETDFKEATLLLKMQTYQGLNDGPGAAKTARAVLAINPNQVNALYLLSSTFQDTFQPGSADAESALSRAQSDARTGLLALEQMQKPPNVSDSQFAEHVKPRQLAFNNTIRFVELQQKDYPTLGEDPPVTVEPYFLQHRAEQGDADAQINLGLLYYNGKGVPQDYAGARKWFLKAAEQGDAFAQYFLGNLYSDGKGVPQDYAEARKWFLKAAEQGDAFAQYLLGNLYDDGKGVPQDHAEASKWWLKAAEQGFTLAQHALGFLYYVGKGVPQDYITAYAWANIAAAQDSDSYKFFRDLYAAKLDAASLGRAQELSREYFKLYVEPFQ